MTDEIKKALDVLDAARKKLTLNGKGKSGNIGAENTYAEAYAQLCRLDPVRFRPVRAKYRG